MRRSLMVPLAALVAGLALLAGRVEPVRAADPTYVGTWKLTVMPGPQQLNFWLVKFESKDGKTTGSVVATSKAYAGSALAGLKVEGDSLRFTLKRGSEALPFQFQVPAAKEKVKEIRGSLSVVNRAFPAWLASTTEKEIDEEKAVTPVDGIADAKDALEMKDAKARVKALKALLDKNADKSLMFSVAPMLVELMVKDKAADDQVRPIVELFTKYTGRFGREVQQDAHTQMGRVLVRSEKTVPLGLDEAKRAAGLVRETDGATRSLAVFKVLASAAKKAGKADETKQAEARIAKLQDRANQEAVETAREGLKALPEEAPPAQRVAFLKRLSGALRKAGKANEAKTTDAEAGKLQDGIYKEALTVARKRLEALTDEAPPAQREAVLKALATILRKTGKADEAKALDTQVAKLRTQLDKEFAKDAIPFEVKPAPARKGKSERVVVVELFTGAQCPPCVSADIAFDAALEAYKPKDAVFLEYHLHIPRPDPLTNADSVARAEFYGDDVGGTPACFVDGAVVDGMGGFRQHGKARFEKLSEAIDKDRDEAALAKVKLSVERKGDKIDLKADVSGLKTPGENVRLRFVLVEDVVSYAGSNRQRLHHHVVRSLPGGAEGFALKEATATQAVSVDLAEVRKTLNEYLTKFEEERGFPDDARPLELKKLKVIAIVQNDETKAILQAVQADVPEGR